MDFLRLKFSGWEEGNQSSITLAVIQNQRLNSTHFTTGDKLSLYGWIISKLIKEGRVPCEAKTLLTSVIRVPLLLSFLSFDSHYFHHTFKHRHACMILTMNIFCGTFHYQWLCANFQDHKHCLWTVLNFLSKNDSSI